MIVLQLLKNFCIKVKNCPVAICPKLPEDILSCQDLESLLDLGNGLSDKSSLGRMRDLYARKLFSSANCLDCTDKHNNLALMYLLQWTLQEKIIRNPGLPQEQRLDLEKQF
jgi:hypothetical protein